MRGTKSLLASAATVALLAAPEAAWAAAQICVTSLGAHVLCPNGLSTGVTGLSFMPNTVPPPPNKLGILTYIVPGGGAPETAVVTTTNIIYDMIFMPPSDGFTGTFTPAGGTSGAAPPTTSSGQIGLTGNPAPASAPPTSGSQPPPDFPPPPPGAEDFLASVFTGIAGANFLGGAFIASSQGSTSNGDYFQAAMLGLPPGSSIDEHGNAFIPTSTNGGLAAATNEAYVTPGQSYVDPATGQTQVYNGPNTATPVPAPPGGISGGTVAGSGGGQMNITEEQIFTPPAAGDAVTTSDGQAADLEEVM